MSKITRVRDLVPDKLNANKGTERGSGMLEHSLRTYGAGRSILVDKKGRIIAGNKTVESAAAMGMDKVEVVQTDGRTLVVVQRTDLDLETDAKAKELAIADNRIAEVNLDWDAQAIATLVNDGADLTKMFHENELKDILEAEIEDEAPEADLSAAAELAEKWSTAPGQVLEIGRHRLMCGDATSAADCARLMGKEKASLVITDPPYGVSYQKDAIVGDNLRDDALAHSIAQALAHSIAHSTPEAAF